MKTGKIIALLLTHALAAGAGFAAGIYALPILIAPPAPSISQVEQAASAAMYTATFKRELADSDSLHWGEGTISIGAGVITFMGELAPGPDYQLYLSPQFVETEAAFNQLKPQMVRVGPIKTFDNFIVNIPPGISPASYNAIIVWCETFGQFISAAKYQ